MSSVKTSEFAADNSSEVNIALMMLRKPTDLKKVIESVPKPVSAVPKNGLPMWFRLGLESKLPMPKMPLGKVVFSRGKIGEDVSTLVNLTFRHIVKILSWNINTMFLIIFDRNLV